MIHGETAGARVLYVTRPKFCLILIQRIFQDRMFCYPTYIVLQQYIFNAGYRHNRKDEGEVVQAWSYCTLQLHKINDIVQAAMRNRKLKMKNGVDPPRIKREPKSWPVCLVKWPQSV